MRKFLTGIAVLLVVAIAGIWYLTRPVPFVPINAAEFETGDPVKGETLFWAGGCASCHADEDADGEDRLKLGGGHRLETIAGVFVVPNISPDVANGIGSWSGLEFANAMLNGLSPENEHYYPAFPYTSYSRMRTEDIADLWAFMKTLPSVERTNEDPDLQFPFSVRRKVGVWKYAFLRPEAEITGAATSDIVARGRYLVEGPGHCGECHTPRTAGGIGGMDFDRWLAGGPAPEGDGRIPNITPHPQGIGNWSETDIAYYLETGFTPDFDSVGGSMVSVQKNMAQLTASDREAISAYLKSVPAIATQ